MTGEIPPSIDPNRAVYDHFMAIKHKRRDYLPFTDVPYSPDELHNLSVNPLPYSGIQEKTSFYVSLTPEVLAGKRNFRKNILPAAKRVINEFGLAEILRESGVVACYNHIFFADDPLLTTTMIQAATDEEIYPDWGAAADHSYSVASRMIDTLGVQITRDEDVGHDSVSYNGLRHVEHVIRTLPNSINGLNIAGLDRSIRREHNSKTQAVFVEAAAEPGNIVKVAGGATHDGLSGDGTEMTVQEPARDTIGMMLAAKVPILYLAVKCVPLIEDGVLTPDENAFIEGVHLDEEPTSDSIKEGYSMIAKVIGDRLPGQPGFEKLDRVGLASELAT